MKLGKNLKCDNCKKCNSLENTSKHVIILHIFLSHITFKKRQANLLLSVGPWEGMYNCDFQEYNTDYVEIIFYFRVFVKILPNRNTFLLNYTINLEQWLNCIKIK